MKIARVTATPVHVPIKVALVGAERQSSMAACLVEIETDTGIIGHGFTSITEEDVIARAIDAVAGPAIIGDDPLAHERVWDKLYWELMPRGQTGYAAHALAAIDVALWDIKGKALGQPIWRLLGGARARVPVYVTFGFDFFDRGQLAEAAKLWVKRGFTRLKMTVGNSGLRRRDERPLLDLIREDEARVRAVREAAGPDVELFVDANCSLDHYHAHKLAEMIKPYRISFFEEPITQNDVAQMALLRRQAGIPLACGQNEGLMFRFRDLLVREAIDYAQPNVVIGGGFTQCVKIAGMAAAFNVPIANGGAWQYHNMHLQAGVANGSLVEIHYLAEQLYRSIYDGVPTAEGGWLTMPEGPGLGFTPRAAAVKEFTKST
jgi:L-alanine-DL-glutamate epimerase-like enolase superfamily enzyme